MLNQVLAVLVILLPTLFAVVLEVVSKEIKENAYWRVGVLAFGMGLSALTWFQVSRATKAADADRQNAIVETSQRVSAEVSKSVTQAVTNQYANMVASQKKQIED